MEFHGVQELSLKTFSESDCLLPAYVGRWVLLFPSHFEVTFHPVLCVLFYSILFYFSHWSFVEESCFRE